MDELCERNDAFAVWLIEKTANRIAFLRLYAVWQRSGRLAALRSGQLIEHPSLVRRPFVQALATAACVAVAVLGFGSLWVFGDGAEPPAPLRYHTDRGGMQTITLEDGSVVTLNTETSITVAFTAEERRVELFSGEVFFDVASAPERPFRIEAGDGKIEVLGTSFGVERRASIVEVAVSEGTVWLNSSDVTGGSASVLKAGMIGYASPEGLIVESSGLDAVDSRLLWREGRLRFEETPLREVAKEFNRYNTKQLIISDEVTGNIEIGGTFPLDNVDAFARLAENGLGLEARRSGDRIMLAGN